MEDILALSKRHLKKDVIRRAADAARQYFDDNPHDRINLDMVASTTADAFEAPSLTHFIQQRVDAIVEKVQPNIRHLVPPPVASSAASVPAYPTAGTLDLIDSYHAGAAVTWTGPLPSPEPYRVPTADESIAMERLISEEIRKGILLLMRYDDLLELAAQQGLQVHPSPSSLVAKADSDKARKADDYTRSKVNSKDKGKLLESIHGLYHDPNCSSICRQYYAVKTRFPGEPIFMYKSDYSNYYKRIPLRAEDVLKLVTRITIDGVVYAAIPLTHPFGLQDSNAHAKSLTEVMHAINSALDVEKFGISLRTTYIDDTAAFGPLYALQFVHETQVATADRVIGPNGTNLLKTDTGLIMTLLGYLFDLSTETVGLTVSWFTKLLCTLFHELPQDLTIGQKVKLHQVQRTAAYMLRSSTIIRGMQPFSRALYRMIRGIPPTFSGDVYLSADAITDIEAWRQYMLSVWYDASPLRCPMSIPPLLQRRRDQTREQLWLEQATHATDVLHVDASGVTQDDHVISNTWGGGWVVSPHGGPFTGYGEYVLDRLSLYLDFESFGDVDQINVLEFLIALVAIDELACRGRPAHLSPSDLWHVHCWTDNTVALSWLTKHKSTHPLVLYLLHVYTRLQVDNHMIVTMGHIPGKRNVVADALSRQYQTVVGPAVKEALRHLTPRTTLPTWWPNSATVLTRPSACR